LIKNKEFDTSISFFPNPFVSIPAALSKLFVLFYFFHMLQNKNKFI